jgi:succinate-semialdehyde dehydrogenase / glutarate-semialdehyde dehydrogenase
MTTTFHNHQRGEQMSITDTVTTAAPYTSVNPATGAVVESYPTATDADISATLAAGEAAFGQWRAKPIEQRAAVVREIGRRWQLNADRLARLAAREMGKSRNEAGGEIEFSAKIFAYYADNAEQLLADQPIPTLTEDSAVIQRLPLGMLLGVMPWNYPYYQVARFSAPNLLAGNVIVLKHAESVPGCAAAIAELMVDAGVPEGVFTNVYASHAQVADIIADRRIQGVSLTGSERAGSAVAALAGKHLKKCVLELGGSDPYVVLDSADVVAQARAAWRTRISNTGQACNSNKRMIVHESIFDDFVAELTTQANAMRPHDPEEPVDGGFAPMTTRRAAEQLASIVDDAVAHGATLHAGGELGSAPTAYYSPAVLTGVTSEMRAYTEELFGPVAVVYRVDSDDAALQLANDTEFGLGGCVFSTNESRARQLAQRLDVGMANVNVAAGEGPEVPFGGVKRSGFGRELGALGIEEFLNKRLMYVK